jgi:hypothetical protein
MTDQTEALENDEVHVDPDNQQDVELGDADGDGHQDGGPKPPMPEVDVVRQLAEKAGWKPKDQWKGEGWTDASEFLAHQLEKGERSSKRLAQVASQLRQVESQTKAQRKAALDAELDAAVEAGDIEAARRISNEKAVVDEPPAVADFRARNDWFGVDAEATAYVESLDRRYAAEAGGIKDAKAHMQRIEDAVLKRFPEYAPAPVKPANGQRREAPHTARASGAMRNDGGKKTEANLTAEEVSAYKQLHAAGMVKDRKTYAAQLNAAKERDYA